MKIRRTIMLVACVLLLSWSAQASGAAYCDGSAAPVIVSTPRTATVTAVAPVTAPDDPTAFQTPDSILPWSRGVWEFAERESHEPTGSVETTPTP